MDETLSDILILSVEKDTQVVVCFFFFNQDLELRQEIHKISRKLKSPSKSGNITNFS
jgi:hypothetical protein